MNKKYLKNLSFGFTTFEIIVSVSIFTLAIILVGSMYIISQQSYNKGYTQAELTQNARVTLDRMSREIRQSVNIITTLPATQGLAVNEIFIQDGHNIASTTYLKYYLIGSNLQRKHVAYEFSDEIGVYVAWDSVDEFGDPPDEVDLGDKIIGEYFSALEFWGASGSVNIAISLNKNNSITNIKTEVYSRNN